MVDAVNGIDYLVGVLHANGMADFVQQGAEIDRAVVDVFRVHEHGAGRAQVAGEAVTRAGVAVR